MKSQVLSRRSKINTPDLTKSCPLYALSCIHVTSTLHIGETYNISFIISSQTLRTEQHS